MLRFPNNVVVDDYDEDQFPADVVAALNKARSKYGLKFQKAYQFSSSTLASLHDAGGALASCRVMDGQLHPPHTAELANRLEQLANYKRRRKEQAQEYQRILVQLYAMQLQAAGDVLDDRSVTVLGVRREGATLANRLGLLAPGRSFCPSAKRCWHEGGLLVGLAELPQLAPGADLLVIDGAIASGATLIALLDALKPRSATIISAHATEQGIRALSRFAAISGIRVRLHAALTTDGLNGLFYAVGKHAKRRAVGDLGDIFEEIKDVHDDAPPMVPE